MKKLFILPVLLFLLSPISVFGQDGKQQDSSQKKETSYCIIRIYGMGFMPKNRAAFIIYPDSKIEKRDLVGLTPEELLTATMESINLVKNQGYTLVSSSSMAQPVEFFEYIFKKE